MFLKRIELSGFKSFADKTILSFDQDRTGIVGPNGCGKSNITDAVRWVLGEQSAKSLRSGAGMNDIIFAGSEFRKPVNTAKVTLVFDNSAHIFQTPFEEVAITREIHRNSSEVSCYINNTPCRLKDIQELVMDTGLGRDSLSIITQGNISSFADAKPEDRRVLFEEAAGVAKYKKRRKTSLTRLEHVSENLERVTDLTDNLQEQKDSLEVQAKQAQEYLELKEQLSGLEVSFLYKRIVQAKEQEALLQTELLELNANREKLEEDLSHQEASYSQSSQRQSLLEKEVTDLQRKQSVLMDESLFLQKQKIALDEKRKYQLSQNDMEAKIASLQDMLQEAEFEVQDKKRRKSTLAMNLEETTRQHQKLTSQISSIQANRAAMQRQISQLESQQAVIASRLSQPTYKNQGVQAVLNARRSLPGIEGLIGDLLVSEPDFEMAIETALGSAKDQICTIDDAAARRAIDFLKRNRAGRATFLPLNVCKGKGLQDWQKKVLEFEGIVGTADQFVKNEPKYDPLKDRLLKNILIARNMENASDAAKFLKQSVKIVTMDGDVIYAGGAMSGGFNKSNSAWKKNLREEQEQNRTEIARLQDQIRRSQREEEQVQQQANQMASQKLQQAIDLEKISQVLDLKSEKAQSLKNELRMLNADSASAKSSQPDKLVMEIAALHEKQDALASRLSVAMKEKEEIQKSGQEIQDAIRSIRREISSISTKTSQNEVALARIQTKMEQDLLRLNSDYSMTFEAAQQQAYDVDLEETAGKVQKLKRAMDKLGDVNLQAPAQYEAVAEKYNFLVSQKEELEAAALQIKKAVEEMDQKMNAQFLEMFNKINDNLQDVFRSMFGGGRAKLILVDPDDLLNTGIDVDVQPPGKAVKNLQTFSGGEKALIAISVLFAILKARTIPLCIFDEVEAALDQANVERFAKYLANFQDQSQFILVTHRPGTMEQCQTLYGVTMPKDGVSQVLKVLLKDAVSYTK